MDFANDNLRTDRETDAAALGSMLRAFVEALPGAVIVRELPSDARANDSDRLRLPFESTETYVSPAAATLLGARVEALSRSVAQIIELAHPDDRVRLATAFAITDGDRRAAEEVEFRVAVSRTDEARWIAVRRWSVTLPVGAAPRPIQIEEYRDVTAQHAEVAALRGRVASLTHEVLRDPLTGLWNRRGLVQLTQRERSRATRTGKPTSVLLLDLDEFKAVNERLGIVGGDRVLQTVAKTVSQALRPSDIAARIGGDEFVVVLPETDPHDAGWIAERVRRAIERATTTVRVTVSVGVGTLSSEETSVDTIVEAAQSGLRTSKHSGKNRIAGA